MSPAPAAEQLERILYILPAAHRPGGAALDELARALHVSVDTIIADLEAVVALVVAFAGRLTRDTSFLR